MVIDCIVCGSKHTQYLSPESEITDNETKLYAEYYCVACETTFYKKWDIKETEQGQLT